MPATRKLSRRLRESVLTLVCRGLGRLFDGAARLSRQVPPALADLPDGARVVFIKPCCLGDVLLATATVAAVGRSFPRLRLDFVVGEWSQPALAGNPRLDRLVPAGAAGSRLGWRQYLALIRSLRRQGYAAALVLDRSPLLNLLPWLAGIPLRAGVDNRGRGFALNRRATQPPVIRHEAEVYLDVARVAGAVTAGAKLEFYPSSGQQAGLAAKAARAGLNLSRPLAVIHPGGGHNPDTRVLSKRWPPDRFGQVAARLLDRGWQVAVIGAAEDKALASRVVEAAASEYGPSIWLVNLCGELDLGESGVLLGRAGLFVGNDTGFMHLAVACGAPVVAVFGPSSPVAYGPFSEVSRAVAPAQPAAQAGLPLEEYQSLSVETGGIEQVLVESVWLAVEEVLQKADSRKLD